MSETINDQKCPVCIVGVGARTPLGLTWPASAAAARAAIGAIREHPHFVDKTGEPICVAMDAVLSPDLSGIDRLHALALPAIKEALAPLAGLVSVKGPIPLIIGLPEPRPGRPPTIDTDLPVRLDKDLRSPAVQTMIMPNGHSAGLMAMEEAWRRILSGQLEFCVVGGVDSYLEPETLEWLDQEGQLMSAQNRSGFPPGEGAGFCLVAATTAARRHGLEVLAWIIAAATTMEKNLIKSDDICVGNGLSDAIVQVSSALRLPEEKINATYCDLNGERYRNEEFAFTVLRTQSAFVNSLDNVTPVDCWGDTGAASGTLFATLAIASGVRGYASGPRSLMWTSSEGGQRSAVLLYLPIRITG
jgi:3-oxoacyl-[acyl-carrier-protein] synthase-1